MALSENEVALNLLVHHHIFPIDMVITAVYIVFFRHTHMNFTMAVEPHIIGDIRFDPTMWGPHSIAKSVNTFPRTMVCDRYSCCIHIIHAVYTP